MKVAALRVLDFFCLCTLLVALFGLVDAWGVSKAPEPSRVRTSAFPDPTPSPKPLCSLNSVQCCNATAESNSTAAASVLGRLGIDIPEKTVDIGFNCTLISDDDVYGGFCDDSLLCCSKIFNDTVHDGVNTTVGVNCADVGL